MPVSSSGHDKSNPSMWTAHIWLTVVYAVAAFILWNSFEVHGHEFELPPQAVFVLCLVVALFVSNVIAVVASRSSGRLDRRLLAYAHGLGAGPLLLWTAAFGAKFAIDSLHFNTPLVLCGPVRVKTWGFVPTAEGGSTLAVTVTSDRALAARLSFLYLYDGDDHNFASYRNAFEDDPMVSIPPGGEAVLTYPQKSDGHAAKIVQFALCTQPGSNTEPCSFWGYGRRRSNGDSRCPLPPPAP